MVQEPAIDGRIMVGRIQHVTLQIASGPVQRGEYSETWLQCILPEPLQINLDYDRSGDVDNVAF